MQNNELNYVQSLILNKKIIYKNNKNLKCNE